MHKVISTSDGSKTFHVDPSAYALVAYRQVTGTDMFEDIRKMGNGQIDTTFTLNALFVLCYCHDNTLDYEQFFKDLSMKIVTDVELHKKVINMLLDEFDIKPSNSDNNTPSSE